jgi:hypothetical protein
MSREVIVCGLPVTANSVTDEFLKLISSDNIIGIISGKIYPGKELQNYDYLSAQPGFELLKEAGFTFVDPDNIANRTIVMLDCWYAGKIRKTGAEVAQHIIDFVRDLNFSGKIVYFCPGSPRLYDRVCEHLITESTVIVDTTSSIQICYEHFKQFGVKLPLHTIDQEQFKILDGHVNIVGAIGEIYREGFDIQLLVNNIKDTHRCYSVKLGCDEKIIPLSVDTTKYLLTHHLESFNSNLLVIF